MFLLLKKVADWNAKIIVLNNITVLYKVFYFFNRISLLLRKLNSKNLTMIFLKSENTYNSSQLKKFLKSGIFFKIIYWTIALQNILKK